MEFLANQPIYLQIRDHLAADILSQKLKEGEQLASIRQLAVQFTVNVNTIQRAIGELIEVGLVETKRGTGNFVTENKEKIALFKKQKIQGELETFYQKLASFQIEETEMLALWQQFLEEKKEEHHDTTGN